MTKLRVNFSWIWLITEKNNRGCRQIIVVIDEFSKEAWGKTMKNGKSGTTSNEFVTIVLKRKPILFETDDWKILKITYRFFERP